MTQNVTSSIFYIGADDHNIDLFENQFPVPNGMSYNSYIILDEAVAVLDTIDRSKTKEWLQNIRAALNEETPDFLIIQHMEPDHSASIAAFMAAYPDTIVVGNTRTFAMIGQFFPNLTLKNTLVVKDGDTLSLGRHCLKFLFAPMVHWPEVMMTYEAHEKILFCADAFGKFGALDIPDNWADEARRYYFGIVAKYGTQVQNILKKAAALDISILCPLHGPFLTKNLDSCFDLYNTWSSYQPERRGVCICYASIYGATKEAAELLYQKLIAAGISDVAIYDLTHCDISRAVADAFCYDTLVLASATYNGTIFPMMQFFLTQLADKNFQNHRIGLIENGSWAPMANKVMKKFLEPCRNLQFVDVEVTIHSVLDDAGRGQIEVLAGELAEFS